MKEIIRKLKYKDIDENRYLISNKCIIFDLKTDKSIKPFIHTNGYLRFELRRYDGGRIRVYAHRILAKHFKLFKKGKIVNHINGTKIDNSIKNLEWCTSSENNKHAYDNNLKQPYRKYDANLVMKICQCLENGDCTPTQICEIIGVQYNNHIKSLIYRIKNRQAWINISDNYIW